MGVHRLFLSSISKSRENNSVGVHSFLPGVHSLKFPVLVRFGRAVVKCGGTLFLSSISKSRESNSVGIQGYSFLIHCLVLSS